MRPLLARLGDGAARFPPQSISVLLLLLFVTQRAVMASWVLSVSPRRCHFAGTRTRLFTTCFSRFVEYLVIILAILLS